jgi:hypothetical protein
VQSARQHRSSSNGSDLLRVFVRKGSQLGFFRRRLFGFKDAAPPEDPQRTIDQTMTLLTTPMDNKLWKIAEKRKGHISIAAVSEEYDRLILQKYGR